MHGQPPAAPRNRLADETSPYLRQHASNPVDWQPWDEAALARARELDRPILLSIGYSACHWCHVMAHESFEDEATAAVMNRLFVNVKVDREERPDLDRMYQLAHQLLTQRGGGWPLTMFLAPDDLTPFYAGTYFPKQPRYGMPAFTHVLERAAAFYRTERAGIRAQNESLRGVFAELEPPAPEAGLRLTREPIAAAVRQLAASYDPRHGGFGPAPKFPHAASLELLLRESQPGAGHPEPDPEAGSMAVTTLRRMSEGGLFDQLGGGFCRYSVDPFWMIPHFEKMLYDNGPLLALCAQAAVLTGDGTLRAAALATAGWALREMRAPGGGFHAALDADSEGHEGRFYAWRREEIEGLLAPDEYRVFARRFGLDREPNFEGAWHLHAFAAPSAIAREAGIAEARVAALLESAREKLLAARGRRVRPGLDDKVLTAWNGLMIRGLAVAGRLLDEPAQVEAALAAVDFLRREAWRNGMLHAAWKDGVARYPAYLDDHAFLLDGLLEVLQSRFRPGDLRFACEVADALIARFADRERGGFWFTAEGEDTPLGRPKGFADESMASGNGVAAQALARLGWLTGEARYLEAAESAVRGAFPSMARAPQAHAAMLNALDEQLDPVEVVIIRGEADEAAGWLRRLARDYAPRRMALALPAGATGLPEALAGKPARERIAAYRCRGPVCSEPVFDVEALALSAARP